MPRTWPAPADVEFCRGFWRRAAAKERREICSIEHNIAVLDLRMAQELLVMQAQLQHDDAAACTAAVEASRRRVGLHEVEWQDGKPRTACLSLRFCARDRSFESILGAATPDAAEFQEIWDDLAALHVVGNAEGALGKRGSSWEQAARHFFTLALAFMLERCRLAKGQPLAELRRVLQGPLPRTLRSWPAKKALAELRAAWAGMAPVERLQLTRITGSAVRFVQTCELAVRGWAVEQCRRRGLPEVGLLDDSLQALRLDCLAYEYVEGRLRGMHLKESFLAEAGCLDHLCGHSVRSVVDAEDLVQVALASSPQLVEVLPVLVLHGTGSTWADLARIVCTLVLHQALQNFAVRQQAAQRLAQASASAQLSEQQRRRQKAQRRGAKAKAAEADRAERARLAALLQRALPWPPRTWMRQRTFVAVEEGDELHELKMALRRRSASVEPACGDWWSE